MDGQAPGEAELVDLLKSAPELRLWLEDGELRYRAPKGLMTENLLHLIKSNKSVIVDVLRRQSDSISGQVEQPTYRPLITPESYRMRLHDRYWQNRHLFGVDYTNGPMVMRRVPGSPNLDVVRELIDTLQRRHDVLWGRFAQADGHPVLSMNPRYKVPVYVRGLEVNSASDWDGWEIHHTEQRDDESVVSWVSDQAWRPLDPETEAWRVLVSQIDSDEYLLGFVFHHFICDFYALSPMASEIEHLYGTIMNGGNLEEVQCSLNYYDYITGVLEWVETPKGKAAREYWRTKLRGMPGTAIPDDKLPSGHSRVDDMVFLNIPPDGVTKITEACSSANCTFFMALLAAQFSALQRMTGSDDFTIWSFREGRSDNALAGVLGMLVDEVPYRVKVPGDASMREILEIVREVVLESEEHVPYPSALIREMLSEIGASPEAPNFNFVPPSGDKDEGEDLASVQNRWTAFALDRPARGALTRIRPEHTLSYSFRATIHEGNFFAQILYATHRYREETMERFVTYVRENLEGLK